jgi:hypothetical protein
MSRKDIHLRAIVSALMLLCSTCPGIGNQIINGEFDAGTTLWQRYGDDAYTIEVVQGAGLSGPNALKIDIFDAAAQESITVAQAGLVLKQGTTYQIGFLAKADADRQMRLLLRQAGTGVDAWHHWTNLTTLPQTFSFEYTHVNTTMENVILYFILKNPSFPLPDENENIDVYIDGVSLSTKPPPDPNLAHYPWPLDGATLNSTRVTLSWSSGRYATSHNVYFGDNFDEVYNGTGNTFVRNQFATDLVISYSGDLKIYLVPGTTYYWRVDEFDGAAIHKGEIWNFTTVPAGFARGGNRSGG